MLTRQQEAFLKKIGYEDIACPMDKDTLLNAEILSENLGCRDKVLAEKILNLPLERQDELIAMYWSRPEIDLSLAANASLSESQFNEHLRIAHYNYETEYGDLKDSGRVAVDKSIISDQSLSANQLFTIAEATSEGLDPKQLMDDQQRALPELTMREMLNKMRISTANLKDMRLERDKQIQEIMKLGGVSLAPGNNQFIKLTSIIDAEPSLKILPLPNGDIMLNQAAKNIVVRFLSTEVALKNSIQDWEKSIGNPAQRSEISAQSNVLTTELQKIAQASKPMLDESLPVKLSFMEQRMLSTQTVNLKSIHDHLNKGANTLDILHNHISYAIYLKIINSSN